MSADKPSKSLTDPAPNINAQASSSASASSNAYQLSNESQSSQQPAIGVPAVPQSSTLNATPMGYAQSYYPPSATPQPVYYSSGLAQSIGNFVSGVERELGALFSGRQVGIPSVRGGYYQQVGPFSTPHQGSGYYTSPQAPGAYGFCPNPQGGYYTPAYPPQPGPALYPASLSPASFSGVPTADMPVAPSSVPAMGMPGGSTLGAQTSSCAPYHK